MGCSGPSLPCSVPSSHDGTPELTPHMLATHSPSMPRSILSAWLLLPEAEIPLPTHGYLKWDFLFKVFLNCLLSHNLSFSVKLASSLRESVAFYLLCVTALFMFAGGMIGCVCASLMSRGCLPGRKCFLLIFVPGTSRMSEISKWCLSYFKLS